MPSLMIRLAKKSGPLSEDGGNEDLFEHKGTAGSLKALDRLAQEAGVSPLSQFISEDPENVYDAVDDEDEAEGLLAKLPPVCWFGPTEALPTVAALLARLAKKVEIVGIRNNTRTIEELRDIEIILNYGAKKKAKFRFYREF